MKARGNSKAFHHLIVLITLCAVLALAGPSFAVSVSVPNPGAMENYCVVPPFIGTTASPLVMLMMQRDEKLWHEAYNDLTDVDGDGIPDYTYKHLASNGDLNIYYGYFDSYKCYWYNTVSGRFEPKVVAEETNNYYCSPSATYWSGNFLNWATMTRIDVIRKTFFGGKRDIDNPSGTPAATLERAFLPQDGHSFLKIYACDDLTNCDIKRLTPYDTHPNNTLKKVGILSLCNTTLGGYGNPPVMRAASGDDGSLLRVKAVPGWERWASNERWQCALRGEKKYADGTPIGDDALRPDANDHLGDFTVRLVACDPEFLTGSSDEKSIEHCKLYEQHGNYMPIGMVQEFGEDSSMYFGLMTGSYDRNKSGGVLRAQLSDFGDLNSSDVNRTTGQFTNLGAGVWPTLKSISIANYDYSTGSYEALDNCPDGLEPFSDGQCSNWGNPLAEMYYEGLRYFVGRDTATTQYQGSDSNVKKPSMNLPSQTWNPELDPYNKTNVEPCAEAFALVISDPYPSYDGDQLPKTALGAGVTSDLPSPLPDLNVAELAREIGDNEGIHGKEWLVGYIEGGMLAQQDEMCTPKTVSDLSKVKGICPLEPGREGSYYLPAMALYGQRTDLRPGFTNTTDGFGQTGNQNLTTYAVALGGATGELEVEVNGSPIKIIPTCFNNTIGKPCTLLELRHAYFHDASGYDVYYFSWEDSQQGGDYDQDADGQLWIKRDDLNNRVVIIPAVGSKSTDAQLDIGFAISGTNNDGLHLIRINSPEIGTCKEPVHEFNASTDINCWKYLIFNPGTIAVSPPKSPLWLAAKYGGFKDANENGIPDQESEWDGNGDGVPDTYFEVSDEGGGLEKALLKAFSSILFRVTSGTAASVLASGEGSGANIVQAVYYPRKRFPNAELNWLGSLHNYWYYVDPFFKWSSIREDTPTPPALYGDNILNLATDNIVHMYFDDDSLTTKVDLYKDSDGDGIPDYKVGTRGFGDVSAIWKAGLRLWARDITTDARTVYTVDEMDTRIEFSVANVAKLAPLMNVEDRDGDGSNIPETEDIIRYVLGEHIIVDRDKNGAFDHRSRVAGIDLNGDGDIFDTVSVDLFGDGAQALSETNVWKLGDIVDSTPAIASYVQVNDYDQPPPIAYGDETYYDFSRTPYKDDSGMIVNTPASYKTRGRVYVGANDGMLHAFKLGRHPVDADGNIDTMSLTGTNLGWEEWAFIPRNALPYLKFLADEDYCHVNTIDLSPYLVDASVVLDTSVDQSECDSANNIQDCIRTRNSWRTILIGGMRFGGACDSKGKKTTEGVESPVSMDFDGDGVDDHGFSSYFALDVTKEGGDEKFKFLWEFTDPDLGFSTTGPAIVRINGEKVGDFGFKETDKGGTKTMGRWFAVFGSGPTGPIDTTHHQFLGHSDTEEMKFFAVDLWTGNLEGTIGTNIPKAFAGSMLRATVDADKDYSDDVLYIGYTKPDSTGKTWTNGGVGRILTAGDVEPDNWVWRELVDNIGPVTSGPTKIFHEGRMWVYPATGRYFYKLPKELDDEQNRRMLLGVIDPCFYEINDQYLDDLNCLDTSLTLTMKGKSITVNAAALADATTNTKLSPSDVINKGGWYIELEEFEAGTGFGAERVVTDVEHSLDGYVFFTSFKPYNGACVLGGRSYLWVVNYDNGGAPGAGLKGKALVQVSTGAIEEIDLKDALKDGQALSETDKDAGKTETYGRRTASMEGVPPVAQGLSIMGSPAATKKIIHFRER